MAVSSASASSPLRSRRSARPLADEYADTLALARLGTTRASAHCGFGAHARRGRIPAFGDGCLLLAALAIRHPAHAARIMGVALAPFRIHCASPEDCAA